MRGGKREGAGRKKLEPTTTVRVPNAILQEVKALIAAYKSNKHILKLETKIKAAYTLKSETEIEISSGGLDQEKNKKANQAQKPVFPRLSKDQVDRLRNELLRRNVALSKADARRMTDNPRLCKRSFFALVDSLASSELVPDSLEDISELYFVDE